MRKISYKKLVEAMEKRRQRAATPRYRRSTYLSELGRGLVLLAQKTSTIELASKKKKKFATKDKTPPKGSTGPKPFLPPGKDISIGSGKNNNKGPGGYDDPGFTKPGLISGLPYSGPVNPGAKEKVPFNWGKQKEMIGSGGKGGHSGLDDVFPKGGSGKKRRTYEESQKIAEQYQEYLDNLTPEQIAAEKHREQIDPTDFSKEMSDLMDKQEELDQIAAESVIARDNKKKLEDAKAAEERSEVVEELLDKTDDELIDATLDDDKFDDLMDDAFDKGISAEDLADRIKDAIEDLSDEEREEYVKKKRKKDVEDYLEDNPQGPGDDLIEDAEDYLNDDPNKISDPFAEPPLKYPPITSDEMPYPPLDSEFTGLLEDFLKPPGERLVDYSDPYNVDLVKKLYDSLPQDGKDKFYDEIEDSLSHRAELGDEDASEQLEDEMKEAEEADSEADKMVEDLFTKGYFDGGGENSGVKTQYRKVTTTWTDVPRGSKGDTGEKGPSGPSGDDTAVEITPPTEDEWSEYIQDKNKRDREATIRGGETTGGLGTTPGINTSIGISSPGY